MNLQRRVFNRYLLTGLAVGASIGYFAGRYDSAVKGDAVPLPAVEALRVAANSAEGVHLIGLSIDGLEQFSLAETERLLLARLDMAGSQPVRLADLTSALDAVIRREYAESELARAGEFLLSETERLFVAYSLISQGLNEIAYDPPVPEVHDGIIAADVRISPKFTVVGKIFNEQQDGHGALVVLAEDTPPGTVITVNGREIKTKRKQKSLTGAVYDEHLRALISKPGRHEIALFVPGTGTRQIIGELEIRPRPPAAILENGGLATVFCEMEKWSAVNDGNTDSIRIETLCGPRSSAIYIGDVALATRVHPNRIVGQFSSAMFSPGRYPVRLIDLISGEAVALGPLTIE